MKKKIAIVFNRMIVGGAEKALINFLNAIDKSKYDITLFTFNNEGAYFDLIPKDVTIKYTKFDNSKEYLKQLIRSMNIRELFNSLFCRIMIRLCRDEYKKFSYTLRTYPKFDEQYDCAIAYKMNFEDTATVIWRILADKKCAIMHSDINRVRKSTDRFILLLLLLLLDKIFCVSRACQQTLKDAYPMHANKTEVMYNIFPYSQILNLADRNISPSLFENSLVTVGRLSAEKGQQLIPRTTRLLLDAGYDIHWYLIGDGPLRETVELECSKNQVHDRVHFLGSLDNPYPYIKNCDIYVQPSFSEGYCTTTIEAKILKKPIVTTNAPGMREQFVSGENGIIVDAMTPESLFKGIKSLLDHPELREKLAKALSLETFDNTSELDKLYRFIES